MKQGEVNIRGKIYQTVALRVGNFRQLLPAHSLVTEILHRDMDCVVMKATISDENGRVIATGHAEEYRKASDINKTSALENAETSAIGRALASLGLGGTEFASADEVARAISGAKGDPSEIISPVKESVKATDLDAEAKNRLEEMAISCIDYWRQDNKEYALQIAHEIEDNEEKIYFWNLLSTESKLRAFIKANPKGQ